MKNNKSQELMKVLNKYSTARKEGKACYMDSDDYLDVVEHFCRCNMYKAALEATEAGLEVHPDCVDLKISKVNTLICTKQFEKAKQVLDTIDPEDNIDVYFFRGELLVALNQDFDGAEKSFRKWIEEDEKNVDFSNPKEKANFKENFMQVLASVYELKHWMYSSTSLIHNWVELYIEKCSPLTGDMTDQELVKICHEEMMLSDAIRLWTAVLDNNPYIERGWTYLATLYNMVGDNEEALNAAEFALSVNPNDYSSMALRGACLQRQNNFVEAEKMFRKYIETTGDMCASVALAECLVPQGKTDEAHECLKMSEQYATTRIKDKSQQLEQRKYISSAYYVANMYKDALRLTNLVLKYDPLSVEYILQKAGILLRTGKVESAVTVFNTAIDVAGEAFDTVLTAALELYDEKQWAYAVTYFKMIIDKRMDLEYMHYYAKLAVCCYKTGDIDGFLENLQWACNLCADDVKATWWNELEDGDVSPEDYYTFLKKWFVDEGHEMM